MAEELQSLIDRIQREAVDTGEKEAARIVSQARDKAAAIVKEAEAQAKTHREQAEQDAQQFTDRSLQALEQASRDVLITVGQGVERLLNEIVANAVDTGLSEDVLKDMLVKFAEGYAAHDGGKLEVMVSEDDKSRLEQAALGALKQALGGEVELTADRSMTKGFKARFTHEGAVHDFSREAMAEALGAFLRPRLAEVVHRVAREASTPGGANG